MRHDDQVGDVERVVTAEIVIVDPSAKAGAANLGAAITPTAKIALLHIASLPRIGN
jgi:hypothetical protein